MSIGKILPGLKYEARCQRNKVTFSYHSDKWRKEYLRLGH